MCGLRSFILSVGVAMMMVCAPPVVPGDCIWECISVHVTQLL